MLFISFSTVAFAGGSFTVVASRLHVRGGAGLNYEIIDTLSRGDTIGRLTTKTVEADGYLWVNVHDADRYSGWAAYKNLSSGTYYLDVN